MEEDKTTQESEAPKVSEADDIKENKYWALLSYLGVLVVIPLIAKKESKFVQFHVKQGLVILVGWIIAWLPFGQIISLFALIFSIVGIVNVLSSEMKKMPIIGELAEKIKL